MDLLSSQELSFGTNCFSIPDYYQELSAPQHKAAASSLIHRQQEVQPILSHLTVLAATESHLFRIALAF